MKRLVPWVAVAVAGCAAVSPEYQRPPVPLPAACPQAVAAEAAPIAADWWRGFGDAGLDRLVEQGLGFDADIAQAVARVEQAEALAREAGAARWPTLDASASAGRSRVGRASPANPSGRTITGNAFSAALSAAYEIDFWGRVPRADEAARAQLLASQAARDMVRLSVVSLVAQGWFALRSLDEKIVATRLTLKSRQEGARLVGLRVQAGTASRLEAEQADLLRADAALQLRELQRQRALALSQLGLLAGDGSLHLPEGSLRATTLPPALLERRPDVCAAEQQLVAANAQVGVARAAMFPRLSLTGALLVHRLRARAAALRGRPARRPCRYRRRPRTRGRGRVPGRGGRGLQGRG